RSRTTWHPQVRRLSQREARPRITSASSSAAEAPHRFRGQFSPSISRWHSRTISQEQKVFTFPPRTPPQIRDWFRKESGGLRSVRPSQELIPSLRQTVKGWDKPLHSPSPTR